MLLKDLLADFTSSSYLSMESIHRRMYGALTLQNLGQSAGLMVVWTIYLPRRSVADRMQICVSGYPLYFML